MRAIVVPLLVWALLVAGCSPAAAPATPPLPAKPPVISFPDDAKPLLRFHSQRFALFLPLPDGHAWRIDDHSGPTLVATHPPTRSRVLVSVLRSDDLVGRERCEAMAHEQHLVPPRELHMLEQETGMTQRTFDTHTVVALDPGAGPADPLVGHVMAFGGFLRKCFVFDFSTEVDGAADEAVLSARLAYARARILGGMEIDPIGAVPREKPTPADAPLPPGPP